LIKSRDPRGQNRDPVNKLMVKYKFTGAMGQIPHSVERISSLIAL